VFDYFKRDNQFEAVRTKRSGIAGRDQEKQVRDRVGSAGVFHSIGGDVEAPQPASNTRFPSAKRLAKA
jgi:hypothetical protein